MWIQEKLFVRIGSLKIKGGVVKFSFLKKYIVVCVLPCGIRQDSQDWSLYKRLVCVGCLVSCVFFAGCGFVKKVQHLPQLLTLKRYSQEQTKISEEVQKQNQKFDALAVSISEEGFKKYKNAAQIRMDFGKPVFARVAEHNGRPVEEWLYRHATEFKNTDKIYLYFDFDGNLLEWDQEKAELTQ